ncbi:MAG: riboflavin biosynthesis protein RibF [Candidatus Omnitrophota bacterium]
MKIVNNAKYLKRRFRRPVVGIGIFDGVHRGHKKILGEVVKKARAINGTSVVVTFDPHPEKILKMIGAAPLLTSLAHRLRLLEAEGIDAACVTQFTKKFAKITGRDFIKNTLVKKINPSFIYIGSDFRFGRGQSADLGLLNEMGKVYGFKATGVKLLKYKGRTVNSTLIRSLIMKGRLAAASRLLGRPVSILGTVVRGSRRGRILGYPTANLNPHHEAIPPSGVYAVYAVLGGRRYKGVLNIGVRPTFMDKGAEPTIEAQIFNFRRSIYGRDIEILFRRKLRGEYRFKTQEALIKQIRIDEHHSNMIL